MIKRIIALVLALCILPLGIIGAYAGEDTELSPAVIESYEVLDALGYINSDFSVDMIEDIGNITRAEFAEMTYKVFGQNRSSKEVYFHDVPATHFAAEAIASLVELNILSLGNNKLFNPDQQITRTEAAKILLCALGYDSLIKLNGGWPKGVEAVAQDLDLYDNIKSGEYLSYADMFVIFYNSLTTEIMEMTGINNKAPVFTSRGGTYLSVNRDIYIGRGFVSAVDGVSIYGDKAEEDRIQIDDNCLDLNGINVDEYLGREVEYFYLADGTKDELVWIKARNDDDVLVLNKYDDQPEFSQTGDTLSYYTAYGKRKSVKINNNLNVVYNGAYVSSGIKEVLSKDFYEVKLIKKSRNSSSYDFVIINDYENYRVISKSDDNIVYLECCNPKMSNRKIILDDYKKSRIVTSDGANTTIADIFDNNIVSVFESKNKEAIKFVVSANSVSGKIDSVVTEDDYSVYYINGEKYSSYNSSVKFDCKINDEVAFLLDMNGRIAKMEFGKKAGNFAYLISAAYDSADDKMYIKMYTYAEGVKQYTIKDKIKIDGKIYKKMSLAFDSFGGEAVKPQIVAYKFDSEGNISMFDFATTSSDKTKKTSDNMLVKIEEASNLYDNLGYRLGQKTMLNADTVVFGVPANVETAEDKFYGVATASQLAFERQYTYISYSYNLDDEYFFADVLSMIENFSVEYWVSTRFAVNSVIETLNDEDEPIYIVSGYHGSEKKDIKLRATCNPDPKTLHQGDVIAVGDRIGDEIMSYLVLYCPHTNPHTRIDSNTGYSTGGAFDFSGYVYDVKNRAVKVGYNTPSKWNQIVALQSSKVLLYENDGKEHGFKEINPADILTYKTADADCDKVFVYINSSQMRNFIVFREK